MFAALITAAEQAEPSKTGFYVMGFVLVAWAFGVTFFGMRSSKWPSSLGGERGVVTVSVLLVAGTMAAAILTS